MNEWVVRCGAPTATCATRRLAMAFVIRAAAGLAATLLWHAQAVAGVTPEVSRVVFLEHDTVESLQVFNVNKYPVLVQAWIDDGKVLASPQDSKAPIIVLPPIFRMDAGNQISLRLLNSGASLPSDRESLFWLNLYEIPATPKDEAASARIVTVTMRTQLKVFVRPDKLPYPESELPKHLTFSLVRRAAGSTLEIGNPTPYYATLGAVQIAIGGAPEKETVDMIAPFSSASVDLGAIHATPGERAKVVFSLLNDEGNPMVGERDVEVTGSDVGGAR